MLQLHVLHLSTLLGTNYYSLCLSPLPPLPPIVAQFMHVLRQRIQLGATETIYLMVNGVTPATRYVYIHDMTGLCV